MTAADAYLPTTWFVAALAGLLLAGAVLGDFAVDYIQSPRGRRLAAWALAFGTTAAMERITAGQPAGFRMLAILGALLWSTKAIVLVESRAAGLGRLLPARRLGFVVAWPGMQPRPFVAASRDLRREGAVLVRRGASRLALGVILVALSRMAWVWTSSLLAATVLLLPGLSLILHFGIFNLVAGAWCYLGVRGYPLFRSPLRSSSLTEFWGRRWNLGFAELTAIAVNRPLSARIGATPALLASFACSGLLHELAISVPVRAGFGLPFLYFAIHGGLMLIERALAAHGRPIGGWRGRVWTVAWLVVPLPILFHPPFLRGVAWPLIGIVP